jgi:hypothetical protein
LKLNQNCKRLFAEIVMYKYKNNPGKNTVNLQYIQDTTTRGGGNHSWPFLSRTQSLSSVYAQRASRVRKYKGVGGVVGILR